jgi:SAM-dependent methyltransferase
VSRACPLCGGRTVSFHEDVHRPYRRCPTCALVSVPPSHHLDPAAERAFYDLHENRIDDPGYRRFLSRAADPLRARLAPPARVLDVGCGPGPALAAMLAEDGYEAAVWDPLYAPDPAPLARTWDGVTCTEVVEHAHDPAHLWALLLALRRPGGVLVVMTKRWTDPDAFAGWHYIRDPTHVAFHHADTLRWIARRHGVQVELVGKDVAVFGG